MRIESDPGTPFPRWTCHSAQQRAHEVRYVYDRGERVQVEYRVYWASMSGMGFTAVYDWMDPDDRKILQADMPFLRRAEDLESVGGPNHSLEFVLHATNSKDRSVLVVLSSFYNYGLDPYEEPDHGYADKEVSADKQARKALIW